MEFGELVEILPFWSRREAFPIVSDTAELTYRKNSLPEFISPRLSRQHEIGVITQPQIIIISAAGAVGKSTLATELAAVRHAPMWDLARSRPVGNASLTGRLTEDFGVEALSSIYQALHQGELFLVIDALDESRMKANVEGYQAFISNVADVALRGKGLSFVLLGRTIVAEDTWCFLDDRGVRTELLTIEPFGRDQACEFVPKRIQRISQVARERISASPRLASQEEAYAQAAQRIVEHAGPFEAARDLIFDHLKRAIKGEQIEEGVDTARHFLGYAPVLEAVAFLLAGETNYQELCNSLNINNNEADSKDLDRPISLLHNIVRRILERERVEKVQRNLRPVLEPVAAGWSHWESLFSVNEQCARLLGILLKSPFSPKPFLPPSLQDTYDKSIGSFITEHPFLNGLIESSAANVVFESYLFARGLYENLGGYSDKVEQHLARRDYKPSRLLADFYLLFMVTDGADLIRPQHLGFLYDSLLAGETERVSLRLALEGDDPHETATGNVTGQFHWVRAGEGGDRQDDSGPFEKFEFNIPMQSEHSIQFTRQLKQAKLLLPCSVVLGCGSSEFQIGPDVDIECRAITLDCESLVVRRAPIPNSPLNYRALTTPGSIKLPSTPYAPAA